jgi:hypothetical protein
MTARHRGGCIPGSPFYLLLGLPGTFKPDYSVKTSLLPERGGGRRLPSRSLFCAAKAFQSDQVAPPAIKYIRFGHGLISARRGLGRSTSQPSVQRTCVRQQARSKFIWTAPKDRCPRSRRPSLPVRGCSRRLGGVAGSIENWVAARCGPNPAAPDIGWSCACLLPE